MVSSRQPLKSDSRRTNSERSGTAFNFARRSASTLPSFFPIASSPSRASSRPSCAAETASSACRRASPATPRASLIKLSCCSCIVVSNCSNFQNCSCTSEDDEASTAGCAVGACAGSALVAVASMPQPHPLAATTSSLRDRRPPKALSRRNRRACTSSCNSLIRCQTSWSLDRCPFCSSVVGRALARAASLPLTVLSVSPDVLAKPDSAGNLAPPCPSISPAQPAMVAATVKGLRIVSPPRAAR
mmetsp:Transcript_56808/g.143976  ORF Transcript_56808/g.143976 Transcript_56808/m.143976 type:complete len:244 (-) Transcript_56808:65-796(-)